MKGGTLASSLAWLAVAAGSFMVFASFLGDSLARDRIADIFGWAAQSWRLARSCKADLSVS